jgi:hypothetical protein
MKVFPFLEFIIVNLVCNFVLNEKMKYKLAVCCSLILVLFSCKDQKRFAENRKEVQKKSFYFKHTKGWIFYDTPVTEASENSLSSWNEWRIF